MIKRSGVAVKYIKAVRLELMIRSIEKVNET